jgi:hypothetical protein
MDGSTTSTMGNNIFQSFLSEEMKIQVNVSLCLIKHHAMSRYGGLEWSMHS